MLPPRAPAWAGFLTVASCVLRPPAACLLLPAVLHATLGGGLLVARADRVRLVTGAAVALVLSALLDRVWFGHWTPSWWLFLRVNDPRTGVAASFGTAPMHYYLLVGLH